MNVPAPHYTVPNLLSVQGSLTDTTGNPIDGVTTITFSLYAEQTGGAPLRSDTFEDLEVDNGYFSVYLGSEASLDFSYFVTNTEI